MRLAGSLQLSFGSVGSQNRSVNGWSLLPKCRWVEIRDPRLFQIAALSLLIAYGLGWLRFDLRPAHLLAIAISVLATQAALTKIVGLPRFDPRSALVTGLSLSLLLRTGSIATASLAGAVAIGSKFLIRWNGRHIFNPAAFAICAMLLLRDDAWVSAGQWGGTAFFGFLILCMGGFVASRALRSDVALAFLGFYAALVIGRSLWLGDPLAVPLHRLQTGALLVFAFFMISDPKTTPTTRPARIGFAALVASVAAVIAFGFFGTNAPIWAVVLCAPLVPWFDRLSSPQRALALQLQNSP